MSHEVEVMNFLELDDNLSSSRVWMSRISELPFEPPIRRSHNLCKLALDFSDVVVFLNVPNAFMVDVNANKPELLRLFEMVVDDDGLHELGVECVLNHFGLAMLSPLSRSIAHIHEHLRVTLGESVEIGQIRASNMKLHPRQGRESTFTLRMIGRRRLHPLVVVLTHNPQNNMPRGTPAPNSKLSKLSKFQTLQTQTHNTNISNSPQIPGK